MLTILVMLIVLVIVVIVFKHANSWVIESWAMAIGAVAVMVTVILLSLCANVQINEEIEYQNTYYQKVTLEYRLENIEKNNVGNEYLYNDIVEFNNSLRSTKKWANNPWTNWFHNQRIAELDYIELPVS